MPDLPIEPMAALMAQSAVPYGLLHAGTLNLQYANDALQKLYRQHVIVTGISLFGGCPDMQSALRQCRDTQTVQRFAHTAVGVEFELTPVDTGQDLQGIQCIALPGSKPHVQTDERYQRVLNGLPHNVWLCSPQGTIFWTNHTSNLFTYNQREVQDFSNLRWIDKVHPDDFARVNEIMSRGIVSGAIAPYRWRLRDHAGEFHWFLCNAAPIHNEAGELAFWVGVNVNIDAWMSEVDALNQQTSALNAAHADDHLRLVEAQILLAQTQKMELVSVLAGGVAHDLNNLLFVMGLYADMVFKQLSDPMQRENLDQVRASIKKAARLSAQLSGFSGRNHQAASVVPSGPLVEDIADLLRQAVGAEVNLTIAVDPDAGLVHTDKTYLENALINLAINARDAMDGNGLAVLTVSNRQVQRDGETKPYVVFEMRDHGVGMSDEVKSRIFEPFFTTKTQGKGTGLGLPMVKNFIENSAGFIQVESAPGQGTRIEMALPQTLEHPTAALDVEAVATPGQASILLIEDDVAVRDAVAQILYELGHTVTTAFNPESGLRFLRTGLQVDLIISDVRMPGSMTVLDFIRAQEADGSTVPMLFATGYSAEIAIEEGLIDGKHPVLFKPFSMAELSQKIQELLGPNHDGP